MGLTLGVDVGGTFTDVVGFDGETISGRKLPTTADQADGVIEAVSATRADTESVFLHGTTAATNTLLEERGARVALVTSGGFEDVVEIGRQARPSLYDTFHDRPPALVPRDLRVGVSEDDVGLIDLLGALDPEVLAVALIRSYNDPSREIELGRKLAGALDLPVSIGVQISPAFREYERIATTVLNAYLTPSIAGYLKRLDEAMPMSRKLTMTSSGGLLPFAAGAGLAGRLLLSGPAAGVVAAGQLGRSRALASVISFDMGGTSTDVCRVDVGGALQTDEQHVSGRVNRVPSLPVQTIGAGGGSLGWRDRGGALRVGPRSAGADPGPVAYGRGGVEPTVTDANVILGLIPGALALGGTIELDTRAAREAMERFGSSLGLGVEEAAAGIIEVVDTRMERALRAVSVEEGADPRESALVAFGGAGGVHASRLARRLGMRTVLIPPLSGVFSALGLLLAQPRADTSRTVLLEEGSDRLNMLREHMLDAARDDFGRAHESSISSEEIVADVRYQGQSHELSVQLTGGWHELRRDFEAVHRDRFGFDRSAEPIELVNLRAEIAGPAPMGWDDLPGLKVGRRPVPAPARMRMEGRWVDGEVWERQSLPAGFECSGPAVIVETDSAVALTSEDVLSVEEDGTLAIAT